MTKFYAWSSDNIPTAGYATSMTVGERGRYAHASLPRNNQYLLASIRAARANFAGLPIKMRLGSALYEYSDRSTFRQILDGLEELAKQGEAGVFLSTVLRMSIKAKREKAIIVGPKFFGAMAASIERHKVWASARFDPKPKSREIPQHAEIMIDMVLDAVAERAGMPSREALVAKSRNRSLELAGWRHIAYWVAARLLPQITIPVLATYLRRDHTTLLHSIAKVDLDQEKLSVAKELEQMIRSRTKEC